LSTTIFFVFCLSLIEKNHKNIKFKIIIFLALYNSTQGNNCFSLEVYNNTQGKSHSAKTWLVERYIIWQFTKGIIPWRLNFGTKGNYGPKEFLFYVVLDAQNDD